MKGMIGWRNVLIILSTIGAQTFVAYAGLQNGTDPVGLSTIIGAVGATAVGGAVARGFNKRVAPEQ